MFTGELESLGRDEAIELAKRYSGYAMHLLPIRSSDSRKPFLRKVTGAPSSKTSFVVVGQNAGASKLQKIETMSIATINEDEFLELIRSRQGAELDDKQIKAREKEEQKIAEQAKAMEVREKEEEKVRKRKEAALEGTGIAAK